MPDELSKITFFGLTIERPPASLIYVVVALAAVFIGAYGWVKYVRDPDVETLRAQQREQVEDFDETNKHYAEEPLARVPIFADEAGLRGAVLYRDGCIMLTFSSTVLPSRSKLIRGLQGERHTSLLDRFAPALAAAGASCLNPHQGQFVYRTTAPDGNGWQQVWRLFGDKCEHWQAYNVRTGQWDPVIHWTTCNH